MSETPDCHSDLFRTFGEFLVTRQVGESPLLDETAGGFPDPRERAPAA